MGICTKDVLKVTGFLLFHRLVFIHSTIQSQYRFERLRTYAITTKKKHKYDEWKFENNHDDVWMLSAGSSLDDVVCL